MLLLSSPTAAQTAPSEATGNGLPGKRPHGNRISAWGLSASRSAPILHSVSSSLDGVRATGEQPALPLAPWADVGTKQTRETIAAPAPPPPPLPTHRFSYGVKTREKKTTDLTTRVLRAGFYCEQHLGRLGCSGSVMDIMLAVQDACVSGQWLTAILLSVCCFLPSCLPAGQTVDYSSVESVVSRQGDTAILR